MFKKIILFFVFYPMIIFCLNKYNIEMEIDFSGKSVKGREMITFTNTYNFPISNLYFNLYQNGFQEDSTLWKEGSEYLNRYKRKFKDNAFAYTIIKSIKVGDNFLSFKFVSPDDENTKDKTLVEVKLPDILFPENTINVEILWETKLHKYYLRSGFTNETLFLMQWYPKLCVFEQGRWKIHQFHFFTEFYGEFSDFELNFKIPSEWDLVSTGKIFEEKISEGKAIKIIAENVHDVAIVISKELRKVKKFINITPDNPVELNIFYPSEYNYKIPAITDIVNKCFIFYNEWIGPYLYSNFSIVFLPWNAAQGNAGMEYPQLILCGVKHFEDKGSLDLEYVIAHEFAHQYFYGLIGSDEIEEPWLDEGFTTYISASFLEKNYPQYKIHLPLFIKANVAKPFTMETFKAINLNYYKDDGISYFTLPGYQHPDYLSYRIYAYNKPAMSLKTLEKYSGEEKMKIFLQDYFSSFSFLHPHTEDVISLIEENFGRIWAQNFYYLGYKPQIIDYKVSIISDEKFIVKRYGEIFIPVEILVFFSDGTKENIIWENTKNFQIFSYENKKIKKVIIDPEGKILLDRDPLNNIASAEESKSSFLLFFFSKITLLLESILCWF